jgi:quercetin dioxygenase-like cupin family protein
MATVSTATPFIRTAQDGEKRWFYGGAVLTWRATSQETDGAFSLWEASMVQGKVTPLHTHPADETMYVLDGEILMHMDGQQSHVEAGGLVFAPRGAPHAFMVLSDVARLLTLHTPGSCEAFYRAASEPMSAGQSTPGTVDFDRIYAAAKQSGGIEIVGPPPFTNS